MASKKMSSGTSTKKVAMRNLRAKREKLTDKDLRKIKGGGNVKHGLGF
jgi:hypothetical protein